MIASAPFQEVLSSALTPITLISGVGMLILCMTNRYSHCMDRIRAGYGIKPRRAVVVHHIQPIEERPDLALTLSNLRSLCEACHNRRHPEKGGKSGGGKQAKPAARMRVIKI